VAPVHPTSAPATAGPEAKAIVRASSIRPFATTELFHKFEVGLYGYLYRKAVASELISDSRAFLDSTDVGQEVDVFLRWRILSDLGVSVNYGRFFPGKAYQDDSPRNFFSAGLTYAF